MIDYKLQQKIDKERKKRDKPNRIIIFICNVFVWFCGIEFFSTKQLLDICIVSN